MAEPALVDVSERDTHAFTESQCSLFRSTVERIEKLAAEQADIAEMRKALFAELKSRGFSTDAVKRAMCDAALSDEARFAHDWQYVSLRGLLGKPVQASLF